MNHMLSFDRVQTWIDELKSGLWFVPSLFLVGSGLLAFIMLYVDIAYGVQFTKYIPWLTEGTPDAARNILSTIAGSLITVISITFSIIVIALQQASSLYSSRVLRNFTSDRANQVILGVYLGTFTYSLIILRSIRSNAESAGTGFVPNLAVTIAMILAVFCIILLIYFIHSATRNLQISIILRSIHSDVIHNIETIYDKPLQKTEHEAELKNDSEPQTITSQESGFLMRIDMATLQGEQFENTTAIEILPCVGDFIPQDSPIALVYPAIPVSEKVAHTLQQSLIIGEQRSLTQDILFGIRQMTDVAVRSLSTGINDETTTEYAINYIADVLGRLNQKQLLYQQLQPISSDVQLKVSKVTWEEYVSSAFDQIRRAGANSYAALRGLLHAIAHIASLSGFPERNAPLFHQLDLIQSTIQSSTLIDAEKDRLQERVTEIRNSIDNPNI